MTTVQNKDKAELLELLELRENEYRYHRLKFMFPDEGPYRRELYSKHIEFMNKGSTHAQRLFMGANRVGKSQVGAYEATCHLTGEYPEWWEGKRFLNPINMWAIGVTNQSVKEILQLALLGSVSDIGSGLIPKDKIIQTIKKPGVAGAIETVYVKHRSGGTSEVTFKSYEQGRDNFQGTYKQVIWMDEEPRDYGIYEECLMRTMNDTNPGIMLVTFTPLFGRTKLVMSFLDNGKFPEDGVPETDTSKFVTQVTWEEVPHLSEEQKKAILASISPHLRDARTKGIPQLGAGAIFPYPEDDIVVPPFPIPEYWPRAYGLDVGWERTAAIWVTQNPETNQYFLYHEHYQGGSLPAVHASAIKAAGGTWMAGVIDTGSRMVNPTDGKCLWEVYQDEGLNLEPCEKAKESSILQVGQMLLSGQLKVFDTLRNWLSEYRSYSRNEDGKISDKLQDHLMDATLYLIHACPEILTLQPDPDAHYSRLRDDRDDMTGY